MANHAVVEGKLAAVNDRVLRLANFLYRCIFFPKKEILTTTEPAAGSFFCMFWQIKIFMEVHYGNERYD